jgi:hypothetical protein
MNCRTRCYQRRTDWPAGAAWNECCHPESATAERGICLQPVRVKRSYCPLRSVTFSHDELVLVMISLVRATHPSMLRQEADGFSVDFALLDSKKVLDDDERLLFKVRATLDTPFEEPSRILRLDDDESRRMLSALAQLQRLQAWPADVLAMCRSLRARLTAPAAQEDSTSL